MSLLLPLSASQCIDRSVVERRRRRSSTAKARWYRFYTSVASSSFSSSWDDEKSARDVDNNAERNVLGVCTSWLRRQVENASNAAPLLQWSNARLLTKQTAADVVRNAAIILFGLLCFTVTLGGIDAVIEAFLRWMGVN